MIVGVCVAHNEEDVIGTVCVGISGLRCSTTGCPSSRSHAFRLSTAARATFTVLGLFPSRPSPPRSKDATKSRSARGSETGSRSVVVSQASYRRTHPVYAVAVPGACVRWRCCLNASTTRGVCGRAV